MKSSIFQFMDKIYKNAMKQLMTFPKKKISLTLAKNVDVTKTSLLCLKGSIL